MNPTLVTDCRYVSCQRDSGKARNGPLRCIRKDIKEEDGAREGTIITTGERDGRGRKKK